MLGIIICEDNDYQRNLIEKLIKEVLIDIKYQLSVELTTDNPLEVINYVKANEGKAYIYFLDVDLNNDVNGIELADHIRKYDLEGYIIFITSHSELAFLTFQYKVQAMDYIIKSDTASLKKKIQECIETAYKDYGKAKEDTKEKNIISVNLANKIMNFNLDEILFFETVGDHKLRIHTEKGFYEFYGKMKEMENNVSSNYFRTHRAYLVNTSRIKSIDKSKNTIQMINDEICYVSSKYIKGLMKKCLI